jgi:hypothetical protein
LGGKRGNEYWSSAYTVWTLGQKKKENNAVPDKTIDVVLLNEEQTDKSKYVFSKQKNKLPLHSKHVW